RLFDADRLGQGTYGNWQLDWHLPLSRLSWTRRPILQALPNVVLEPASWFFVLDHHQAAVHDGAGFLSLPRLRSFAALGMALAATGHAAARAGLFLAAGRSFFVLDLFGRWGAKAAYLLRGQDILDIDGLLALDNLLGQLHDGRLRCGLLRFLRIDRLGFQRRRRGDAIATDTRNGSLASGPRSSLGTNPAQNRHLARAGRRCGGGGWSGWRGPWSTVRRRRGRGRGKRR